MEGTENRIAVARMDFNNAVQSYDTAVKSFPTVLYAGMFGFQEKPYFNATPGAETAAHSPIQLWQLTRVRHKQALIRETLARHFRTALR